MSCQQCGGSTKRSTMKFCSRDCKNAAQKGKREILDSSKNIRCKIDGKLYDDYLNRSGCLRRYSETVLNKNFDWADWEIITIDAKLTWNCPYCDWKSIDVENKSGWITVHLQNKHDLSPDKHCETYPEDRSLWVEYWKQYKYEQFKNAADDNRVQCKICNEWFLSITNSHLSSHGYTVEQYKNEFDSEIVSKTTSNRLKESYYDVRPELERNEIKTYKPNIRQVQKLRCHICKKQCTSIGIGAHLKQIHNIDVNDYVMEYGEFRINNIKRNDKLSIVGNLFQCKICGIDHISDKSLTFHLSTKHNIEKIDYIKKYIFDNISQKCECGCGLEVSYLSYFPYKRRVISGHNKNPMTGKCHNNHSKKLMRYRAVVRGSNGRNKIDTSIELKFKKLLINWGIDFIHQAISPEGRVDFYIESRDLYVEIDGDYWHPVKVENLSNKLLNSCVSQIRKNRLPNLIRIRASVLDKIVEFDDLYRYQFRYDFSLGFDQVICNKEYLSKYPIDKKPILIQNLLKVIREYSPEFPYPPTVDDLSDILIKIASFDLDAIFRGNTFNNNTSSIGNRYLKSLFKSYWNSSFRGKKTPVEVWNDDSLMKNILAYRVGFNDSGEIFDITLKQCLVGISASRYTVSFFKPVLAAAIYKHFVGDKLNPVVFDPCAGFGGRMLGFKAIYPGGIYIACEPNVDTFNELINLASNFSGVCVYNCKLEDFDLQIIKDVDLSFTSIPYYDLERYSNVTKYLNFDDWSIKFIGKLKMVPKLLINVPESLRFYFGECAEYIIQSNAGHFSKNDIKTEYLLKIC